MSNIKELEVAKPGITHSPNGSIKLSASFDVKGGAAPGQDAGLSAKCQDESDRHSTEEEQTRHDPEGEQGKATAKGLAFKELLDAQERESFPEQLMKLLDDEQAPAALWWMPDGTSFAIKTDRVGPEVLDRFFQSTK